MAVATNDLKAFLAGSPITEEVATMAIDSAMALIGGYCRGKHLDANGDTREGIDAVALTVAARIAANPAQIATRNSAGAFSQSLGVGFTGFTLAEQATLNRYRKRAI